jgi:hypothetical protein
MVHVSSCQPTMKQIVLQKLKIFYVEPSISTVVNGCSTYGTTTFPRIDDSLNLKGGKFLLSSSTYSKSSSSDPSNGSLVNNSLFSHRVWIMSCKNDFIWLTQQVIVYTDHFSLTPKVKELLECEILCWNTETVRILDIHYQIQSKLGLFQFWFSKSG